MTTPEILQFETNGHRISCARWGDKSAPRTILCAHGLTRNGRDFDNLAAALAQDYQVLCPDMPGRGKSQWLGDPTLYNPMIYIADVLAMLVQLSIPRVHWIGTSMGGIMGMMATQLYPGLIDALVLNDIGALIPASGLSRIRDIAGIPTCYADYAAAEASFRARCAGFGIRDEAHWKHLLKYGVELRDGNYCFTYDPAIFAIGYSKDTPLQDVNLWPLWESVAKVPVLLIRGVESDILLRQTAVEMQSRHPNLALHEIADTGHAPALMESSQIAIIQDWLGKN